LPLPPTLLTAPTSIIPNTITAGAGSSKDENVVWNCKKCKTPYNVTYNYGFCGGSCRDEARTEKKYIPKSKRPLGANGVGEEENVIWKCKRCKQPYSVTYNYGFCAGSCRADVRAEKKYVAKPEPGQTGVGAAVGTAAHAVGSASHPGAIKRDITGITGAAEPPKPKKRKGDGTNWNCKKCNTPYSVTYNYGFCGGSCREEARLAKKYVPKNKRTDLGAAVGMDMTAAPGPSAAQVAAIAAVGPGPAVGVAAGLGLGAPAGLGLGAPAGLGLGVAAAGVGAPGVGAVAAAATNAVLAAAHVVGGTIGAEGL
jgi:hypothetical protein